VLAVRLCALYFVLCAWCLVLCALYLVLGTLRFRHTKYKAQSTKYKVQSTKNKAPSTQEQSTKNKAPRTKHLHYNQQTDSNLPAIVMWLAGSLLSLLFVATIVGAPLALAGGHQLTAGTIYQSFSHLCHQLPERSFFLAGYPFAVCARCTGIYAGFAAAFLSYPLIRSLRQTETPARKWLFIAAAPLAIDWSIEFFGISSNTHTSRFITGALLGAAAVFYILPGLVELCRRDWHRDPPERLTPALTTSAPSEGAPSDYSAPHRRI
jgi:uncharacterized membrane protein